MKRIFCSLTACSVMALSSMAAQAATVTVIHGINGKDLGTARSLPVDISVNGTCALKNVTFTQTARVELDAGSYQVKVHPSDGKCGSAPVIDKNATITKDQKNVALVASLSKRGAPQLAVFDNTERGFPLPILTVQHVAFAGSINTAISLEGIRTPNRRRLVNSGTPVGLGFLGAGPKTFRVTAKSAANRRTIVDKTYKVGASSKVVVYLVGSSRNGISVIMEKFSLLEKK